MKIISSFKRGKAGEAFYRKYYIIEGDHVEELRTIKAENDGNIPLLNLYDCSGCWREGKEHIIIKGLTKAGNTSVYQVEGYNI